MGLDCSHGAWHGAYSAFARWRQKLAQVAGIPLPLMAGYYREPIQEAVDWIAPREGGPLCKTHLGPALHRWLDPVAAALPIPWASLRDDVLHVLLDHSDCDGDIPHESCGPLAARLEELLPLLEGDGGGHLGSYSEKTQTFIDGLRRADAAGEPLDFH